MSIRKKWFWLALIVFTACLAPPLACLATAEQEPILVGRIAYVEGQLLRFVPESKDWVIVTKDAPFGMNDALYSDASAKAEFHFPNRLLVRIGASTQIQLIALKSDASEMDVASGVARFYNRNPEGMLKVTTPFGYVLAEPDSSFDLYVGDQSVEVLALNGRVDYFQQGSNARYEVTPGGASVLADATQVADGEGKLDAQWDDWNAARDSTRTKRVEARGESVRRLPPQIQDDAPDLDDSGSWERVDYEGQSRELWRPAAVEEGWRPFTDGRWTDYYGDQVWVPEERESFGYVTHHYGNWLIVNGRWYWSPPAPVVTVVAGPVIGFGWYPGRVAWISNDENAGWVPLAPTDVYYSHNYWGPSGVVVVGAAPVIAVASLPFISAAVIVRQADFYRSPSYRSVAVTNINQTTIINNYHAAPVVTNTVIKNYSQNTARYNFVNKAPTEVPHSTVVQRINQNQQIANTTAKSVTAASLQQAVTTAKVAQPAVKAAVPAPTTLTNKLVAPNQVNAPKDQAGFKQVQMKKDTKPVTSSPAMKAGGAGGGAPGGGTPAVKPAPGVTQPPAPGITRPPAPGTTQPPAGGGGTPGGAAPAVRPAPGVTQPPAPGVTRPPAPGTTLPPAGGGGTPGGAAPAVRPTPGVTQPPAPGVTRPPAPGATRPHAPGTTQPPTGGGGGGGGARPELQSPRPQITTPPATRPQPAPEPKPEVRQPPPPATTRPPAGGGGGGGGARPEFQSPRPQTTTPPATRPQPAPAQKPEVRQPPPATTRPPAGEGGGGGGVQAHPQVTPAPRPAPAPAPRPEVRQPPPATTRPPAGGGGGGGGGGVTRQQSAPAPRPAPAPAPAVRQPPAAGGGAHPAQQPDKKKLPPGQQQQQQ